MDVLLSVRSCVATCEDAGPGGDDGMAPLAAADAL
jgi:hypothetical protein